MGNATAFKQTEPGELEIKTLPSGRLLESGGNSSYFDQANSLFQPLFRYIQKHEISMTTPVEARIEPGTMYFWVAADQVDKATKDDDGVRVVDMPKRTVAAIGAKGAYTKANFEEAKAILLDWVAKQPGLVASGEPYAVYWNGPFTPWFLKKFEVQVELGD